MARIVLALIAVLGLSLPASAQEIGFFSPRGTDARFVDKVDFAMVNVNTTEQIAASIAEAKAAGLNLTLDFGPVISLPRDVSKLSIAYTRADGTAAEKTFAPRADNKLRDILPDDQLRQVIAPFLDMMAANPGVVDTLFMVDEPYLNGVPKAELERAGNLFRAELSARKIDGVKLGVLFASAMFHAPFAEALDRESMRYVENADTYRATVEETEEGQKWVETFDAFRLTTYDAAGNRYLGGGIPQGYDVVAFDYYVSTLLMDTVAENALHWFAANTELRSCDRFYGETVSGLRSKLSFYQDGPVVPGEDARNKDRVLLDDMFDCRMNATLDLLKQEIAASGQSPEVMLIGESSNNGMLEFSAAGTPETEQPSLLVESRVQDEVNRYLKIFSDRRGDNITRIAFFTFDDEFDDTIRLAIGGASSMAGVLQSIFDAAAAQ